MSKQIMLIKSVRGFTPKYGKNCFFAENSTLIGDLIMGDDCSVWYQAVVRGDVTASEWETGLTFKMAQSFTGLLKICNHHR